MPPRHFSIFFVFIFAFAGLSLFAPSSAMALTYLGIQSSGSEAFLRQTLRTREYWVLVRTQDAWELRYYSVPYGEVYDRSEVAFFESREDALAYMHTFAHFEDRHEALADLL